MAPGLDVKAMFDLTGRLAVVTGCRRGIGLTMAEVLALAGADIIGISAHLEPGGSEVQKRVEMAGRSFSGYRVDLADRAAVLSLAAELAADHPPVDILVNNAGTIERLPAAEHLDSVWDNVLETNLTAPFIMTREIGKGMVGRGRGKVIFTASLLSFQGGVLVPSYTASKSGVAGLVRAFSNEWAAYGVNVNAIAPGYIDTDNTETLRADAYRNGAILERVPAGRWGQPEDLAGATLYLASSASDYVCGAILPVDGGWLAR